jgi:hypothetical protein
MYRLSRNPDFAAISCYAFFPAFWIFFMQQHAA